MAFNSPRDYRLFSQIQTGGYAAFNQTSGTWTNTLAKMIRLDQGSLGGNRNAAYSPFPVLTGNRSTVVGVRGRKNATWSIRGLPIIPSGAAGTVPDTDHFFQSAFGAAATLVTSTSATYNLSDAGTFPLSLFFFNHLSTAFTQFAYWGCGITRMRFNFNGLFLTMDLDGFAGYQIDNTGFAAFDVQALASLTTFPAEPSSPTILGSPIAGFGTGYTCTLHSQSVELKTRALSVTLETGWEQVADVYGSPYGIAMVGNTRHVSIDLQALDDDTSALNTLKVDCDTDGAAITGAISAGPTSPTGTAMTMALNSIQPSAFNLRDQGATVSFELPTSNAHATSIAATNEMIVAFV